MSKSIKWILAAILALSVVIVARASLQSNHYLPIVRNSYPFVPTATPTSNTTASPATTVSCRPHYPPRFGRSRAA